ncbi:metal-dependent hydrolase, partial [Desulfovibrio sp. 1188_IL3213]
PGSSAASGTSDTASPAGTAPEASEHAASYILFHDLRFGSSLKLVRAAMASRPNADIPFQYMTKLEMPAAGEAPTPEAEKQTDVRLLQERLRFSDSGRDSQWQPPRPPREPGILDWLVGLR